MTTIKDVARHAGVSYTTVSHVLNKTRPVSSDARDRVLAAVESLDFVLNTLARSLKKNATGMIGLIIPNNTNPYFSEVARGIEDGCYATGYSVILCNSDDDATKQQDYLNVLLSRRCDGLIIATLAQTDVDFLRKMKVPTVLLDRAPKDMAMDLVDVDNAAGGALAAEHLLALGRRHIACIGGPANLEISSQRIAGLRQALQNKGVVVQDKMVVHGDFTSAGGYEKALDLLGFKKIPDAIFCCNDLMAIGALRAAAERGMHVPDALSVIGFDDINLTRFVHPPLTSVSQKMHTLGQVAAQCLLERIANPDRPAQRKTIMPQLHIRGSTVRL